MTNYPLPTPHMFAVHRRVVILTQFRWQVAIETTQAMTQLQRLIGDAVLPALQRFADALGSMDLEGLDGEQE